MCLQIHQQNFDVKQIACVLGVTLICEPQEIISAPSIKVVSENVTEGLYTGLDCVGSDSAAVGLPVVVATLPAVT